MDQNGPYPAAELRLKSWMILGPCGVKTGGEPDDHKTAGRKHPLGFPRNEPACTPGAEKTKYKFENKGRM